MPYSSVMIYMFYQYTLWWKCNIFLMCQICNSCLSPWLCRVSLMLLIHLSPSVFLLLCCPHVSCIMLVMLVHLRNSCLMFKSLDFSTEKEQEMLKDWELEHWPNLNFFLTYCNSEQVTVFLITRLLVWSWLFVNYMCN